MNNERSVFLCSLGFLGVLGRGVLVFGPGVTAARPSGKTQPTVLIDGTASGTVTAQGMSSAQAALAIVGASIVNSADRDRTDGNRGTSPICSSGCGMIVFLRRRLIGHALRFQDCLANSLKRFRQVDVRQHRR